MNKERLNFGVLLKDSLKTLNLRYKDLLELMETECPLDISIVSKWVRGNTKPTHKNYMEIINALCKRIELFTQCGYQEILDTLHTTLTEHINSSNLSDSTKINLFRRKGTKELLQALFELVYYLEKGEENVTAQSVDIDLDNQDNKDSSKTDIGSPSTIITIKTVQERIFSKYANSLTALVFVLFLIVTVSFKVDKTNDVFGGVWSTYSFGILKIEQKGDNINGEFKNGEEYKNGKIHGGIRNNKIFGVWSELRSDEKTEEKGNIEITLSNNSNLITLKWKNNFTESWYNICYGKRVLPKPKKETLQPTIYLHNYPVKNDFYVKYNSSNQVSETYNFFGNIFEQPAVDNHPTYNYNKNNYVGTLYKQSAKFLGIFYYYDSKGNKVELQKWVGYYMGTVRLQPRKALNYKPLKGSFFKSKLKI